eukprot:comp15547_c0_seq1/m.12606 comp15547_c0_seq1/g.12606  ORF comp15547_c0_seq1/g.12606 comp15547_c0_seq1/m.12606 type:complete len:281 (-) comp15547_c0_seq1:284-1126(-)
MISLGYMGGSTSSALPGSRSYSVYSKSEPESTNHIGVPVEYDTYCFNDFGIEDVFSGDLSSHSWATPSSCSNLCSSYNYVDNGVCKQEVVHHEFKEIRLKKEKAGYGVALQRLGMDHYVAAVRKGSAAEKSGLSVGDRILEINRTEITGCSMKQVYTALETAEHVMLLIKPKALSRTIVMNRQGDEKLGMYMQGIQIAEIAPDTLADRMNVPPKTVVVSVNGKSTVGYGTNDMTREMANAGDSVVLEIVPEVVYRELMKPLIGGMKIGNELAKIKSGGGH